MKRMLSPILIATAVAGCLASPVFGQDKGGQMMQTENKMGDTMMKTNDQKMMKSQKKSHRRKKKTHKKSMKVSTMKEGATNPM